MIIENQSFAYLSAYLLLSLADLIIFAYLIIKTYILLCYSKITFDQLPMLNPYKWPFSFFRLATQPYFKFWSKVIPVIKIWELTYDISGIIALQVLTSSLTVCLQARLVLFYYAQQIIIENNL
jgi:hypothetical protein